MLSLSGRMRRDRDGIHYPVRKADGITEFTLSVCSVLYALKYGTVRVHTYGYSYVGVDVAYR